MYQVFGTIILVLGASSLYLYNDNQTLKENNFKLEGAVAEQKAATAAIKESFERQGAALSNMQRANAQIEAEKDRYLDIFNRHNLNKLALLKPGLIETRINNGTKAVFEEIENDSKKLNALNDNPSD
jgi:hypothetical protein|tara:strand:- start:112 stop:492 length:381 start_codon:yes stop_codon:yes gene_type:complete